MRRYGMFKALICNGHNEYNYPLIPEKYFSLKIVSFLLLSVIFGYLTINPPVPVSGIVQLKGDFKIENRVNRFGITRLHKAVILSKTKIVKLLIRNGCDLDMVDDYGWSPLHWANFLKKGDLVDILIKGGAKQDIRTTTDWFVFRKGSLPGDLKARN